MIKYTFHAQKVPHLKRRRGNRDVFTKIDEKQFYTLVRIVKRATE